MLSAALLGASCRLSRSFRVLPCCPVNPCGLVSSYSSRSITNLVLKLQSVINEHGSASQSGLQRLLQALQFSRPLTSAFSWHTKQHVKIPKTFCLKEERRCSPLRSLVCFESSPIGKIYLPGRLTPRYQMQLATVPEGDNELASTLAKVRGEGLHMSCEAVL